MTATERKCQFGGWKQVTTASPATTSKWPIDRDGTLKNPRNLSKDKTFVESKRNYSAIFTVNTHKCYLGKHNKNHFKKMSTIDASSKASIINSTKLRGLFAWYRKWLLFRNEFIPVFIPNEILVLERNFILVSLNWKRTSFWIENRKSCQSTGKRRLRAWSGAKTTLVRTPKAARRCYHVNAVQTSLWNRTHSEMKVLTVSCK